MSNDYRAKGENEKLVSEDIIFTRSVKGGSRFNGEFFSNLAGSERFGET